MSQSPLSEWADQKPGRWILVWIFLLALWIVGSSVSVEPDAKPVVTPVAQPEVQATPLEAMQEQVGPEGVCNAKGCRDKHGRKTLSSKG